MKFTTHHQHKSPQSAPFFGPTPKSSRFFAPTIRRQQSLAEEDTVQTMPLMCKSENGGYQATPRLTSQLFQSKGGGSSLPRPTLNYMNQAFGADFSQVRVHTGSQAQEMSQGIQAKAFTHGSDVYFNRGQYSPESPYGKRLLAHELTHVVQQTENLSASYYNNIMRLSDADCAKNCDIPDGKTTNKGKFLISVYADKEGPFLLLPLTHKVGHSWVRLTNKDGDYWTYGYWPKEGYDSSDIKADVEGCAHHPDVSHQPSSSQEFELSEQEFKRALKYAQDTCRARPNYNLFGLQCTQFALNMLKAAGKAPVGGFGLIWESPNALQSWMKSNALTFGINITALSSSKNQKNQGDVNLDIVHKYQFYSMLGNKLRLYWFNRGELGSRLATASSGMGFEINSQRVFIPTFYLQGSPILGSMNLEKLTSSKAQFGAGASGSVGLNFNVDELISVGVEYNVVKDFVNADPALHRLMVGARLKF